MAKCAYCGKGPIAGRHYARRGKARKEGGAGRKITGVSQRRFLPNLQSVRLLLNGTARRALVCVACLKSGRVVKAR